MREPFIENELKRNEGVRVRGEAEPTLQQLRFPLLVKRFFLVSMVLNFPSNAIATALSVSK